MFEKCVFNTPSVKADTLNYFLHHPKDFNDTKKHPLLIYLHGAGSRGNDLSCFNLTGPLREIQNGRKLSIIVVAPQCHADTWFDLLNELLAFIDSWREKSYVDESRVVLSGVSMGGFTCWQVAMMRPDWFVAAVPVCGSGMYWNAARLRDLPIWAFHGELDDVVSVEESRKMVDAVNKSGGNAKLTVYPSVQHDSWTPAFQEDELYNWLLNQHK